jgi:hypothetical protein
MGIICPREKKSSFGLYMLRNKVKKKSYWCFSQVKMEKRHLTRQKKDQLFFIH